MIAVGSDAPGKQELPVSCGDAAEMPSLHALHIPPPLPLFVASCNRWSVHRPPSALVPRPFMLCLCRWQVSLLARAAGPGGRLVCDSVVQCVRLGELQHAAHLAEHATTLGELVLQRADSKTSTSTATSENGTGTCLSAAAEAAGVDPVSVVDLTGMGVQDAVVAELAWKRWLTSQ